MALTQISTGMLASGDGTVDLNIDNGTFVVDVSTSRMGVGTSSPAYKLDVASPVIQFGDSTDAFAQYKSSAGNWHVGANSSNAFAFYSGTYGSGTERMRIDSSGRLLVGLTGASGFGTVETDTFTTSGQCILARAGGNVGIGTSSPVKDFVVSNGGAEGFEVDAGALTNLTEVLAYNRSGAVWNALRTGASQHEFYVSGTERMRIDSSGMLGLGSTPPTDAHATWSQFFIGEKGSVISEKSGSGGLYGLWLTDNSYVDNDTGAFSYRTTDEASSINLEAGNTAFRYAASGTAGAALTWSESMRIDSSGNVGIGTVPETWQSTIDALQVGLGASFAGNTVNPSRVYLSANYYINSSNQESYIATDEASQYFQNAGTHTFKVAPSGSADSAISWNTAMTIDNSGNVGIGTTTPINTTAKVISAVTAASGSGNSYTIATDTGIYSSRGSIEVGGITNRYIISTALSGNFAANTWYPIMKRSDMVAASGNTATMETGGFGMYFRIYTFSSSIGLGEYFTNRMSEMVWIHSVGANSTQAQELRIGPGFGHAPNTGHNVDDPSNNPIRLRLAHHLGADSTWAGEQTLEIRFNVAITGANPATQARQIIVKGYML
jgi:hypothetical protein